MFGNSKFRAFLERAHLKKGNVNIFENTIFCLKTGNLLKSRTKQCEFEKKFTISKFRTIF